MSANLFNRKIVEINKKHNRVVSFLVRDIKKLIDGLVYEIEKIQLEIDELENDWVEYMNEKMEIDDDN